MKARLDRAESVSQAAVPASSALAKPASLGQVASLTSVVPKARTSTPTASVLSATPTAFFNNAASSADEQGTSPLSVKIGAPNSTPGGFLHFTLFPRSTNLAAALEASLEAPLFAHSGRKAVGDAIHHAELPTQPRR